ncbi:MAG TPA: transglutaminaseTgpA domain-containing protein [Thermoanaerobaculia bacterium]|jgi:transglutaminase-like putative cysteine protease|nr:transglutaminaseTgpA domain-containing protein [Thermoanaerobaculia bacterium]
MSFGRQKRLLLGGLALLAPLPLPFNEIVGWVVVACFMLGVALFLRRASFDPPRWLPQWGMNVLGLAYLPIFLIDFFGFRRGLVQPVLHLCLFAVLVKLFALVRERDKWQALMGIFFIFLAAMGTSVHPSIVLYLVAFVVLTLVVLTRFAFLHVLAGFGREDLALATLPLRGFLIVATAAALVLAVPLFLVLPRVRAPFIMGRGGNNALALEAAGFSDQVTLDSIGRIRGSREVAMRVLEEGGADPDREMRFKAATYEVYQRGSWRRSPMRSGLQRTRGFHYALSPAKPVHWARIWLQPLHSQSMPLPVETAAIEPRASTLSIDEGGAVSFPFSPLEVAEYRVGLAKEEVLVGSPPASGRHGSLDLTGVTPRITALAGRAMGQGTAAERARRLESYLMDSYSYTLDFVGRSPENPIEDFLFRYRSGQCEYFASAMVLMLRSQGIPARLVTGFLGGEYNPFEGYYIVRQNNAHAWVEAYVAGQGWRIFDPTPPAGRPGEAGEGSWLLAQQAWDFVLFRWDRYVLTFGLYDQLQIFSSLRQMWGDFWSVFNRDEKPEEPGASSGLEALNPDGSLQATERPWLPDVPLPLALGLTLAAVGVWVLYLRLRPPLSATAAYRRLRRRLGRSGVPLADSVPPLAVSREAEARYPEAAAPAARVIDFYLRESFGGQALEDEDLEALKEALEEAEKGMRKAG